jgi:hypothetical protein
MLESSKTEITPIEPEESVVTQKLETMEQQVITVVVYTLFTSTTTIPFFFHVVPGLSSLPPIRKMDIYLRYELLRRQEYTFSVVTRFRVSRPVTSLVRILNFSLIFPHHLMITPRRKESFSS